MVARMTPECFTQSDCDVYRTLTSVPAPRLFEVGQKAGLDGKDILEVRPESDEQTWEADLQAVGHTDRCCRQSDSVAR